VDLSHESAPRPVTEPSATATQTASDEFISTAAHELRNPINALHLTLNAIDLLVGRNEPLDVSELQERIRRAMAQVDRLNALLNYLLDISRLSSGHLELKITQFDLSALAREVISRIAEEKKRPDISLNAPDELIIRSDRLKLEEVIVNLLSNAIKYGHGKPVEITLSSQGALTLISVQIKDHGIGIALGDYERIFKRFERGDHSSRGFGLGLWISKEIIQALGGNITLTSKLGAGSTFQVSFPRDLPG
jgi:two-component system, OmpR family, sensor kinase